MADKKDHNGKDQKDPKKKPLKNRRVHVTVQPKQGRDYSDYSKNKEKARETKETLKKRIERAVDDAKEDGSEAQFDAADKILDDDKVQIPKKTIEKVKVKVEGEREDERGKKEKVSREREVEPGD